jgi:hypothetical protein
VVVVPTRLVTNRFDKDEDDSEDEDENKDGERDKKDVDHKALALNA